MLHKRVLALLVSLCFVLSACSLSSSSSTESSALSHEDKPEQLTVYLSASPHSFALSDQEEDNFTLYPSSYTIGTMTTGGEFNSPNGNIFEQAIAEYSEANGFPIEVRYIEEYTGPSDIFQEMVDQGQPLPDLMILPKYSRYDYDRLVEQGYLLDFTPYAEADEAMQDPDLYYQAVLDGGQINQKQYALPLLFNLNALITTQSFLDYAGTSTSSGQLAYEEILKLLEQCCLATVDNNTLEAIYEFSGRMQAGTYIPNILLSAAYTQYYDDLNQKWVLSSETLRDVLAFMQVFNRQEFAPISGWEDQSYIDNVNNPGSKSFTIFQNAEVAGQIGVFLSGGRCGGTLLHNSILTDLAFFNTIYEQSNETLVFQGIPTLANSNEYTANISLFALGFASTQYPEAVYDLARYLMDYTYAPGYGFSVNKEITEAQLESIQNTETKFFPSDIWSAVLLEYRTYEEIENDSFIVKPLGSDLVEQVRYMLDHMAGAVLSVPILEYNLLWHIQCSVGNGEMTPEEGAQWLMEKYEEHKEIDGTLSPFYDGEYSRSLSWSPQE